MAARRKTCRKCKKRKMINHFYARDDGKDGHYNVCKACFKAYWGNKKKCNKCGRYLCLTSFHKNGKSPDGRKYTCKDCCKQLSDLANRPRCDNCVFLDGCRYRVKQTGPEHWDWMPPCFVTSKYHAAYKKEYHASARRVRV